MNPLSSLKKEIFRTNIRKANIKEILENKRRKYENNCHDSTDKSLAFIENSKNSSEKDKNESFKKLFEEEKPIFIEAIKEENIEKIEKCVFQYRTLLLLWLNVEDYQIFVYFHESGLLPYLFELISPKYFVYEKLMDDLFWILIDLATSSDDFIIDIFYDYNLPKKCYDILYSQKAMILIHNALWLIGNLAYDSKNNKCELLTLEFFDHVEKLIEDYTDLELKSDFLFLLQNCVKFNSFTYVEIRKYILTIFSYLSKNNNLDFFSDATNALSTICISLLQDDPEANSIFIQDMKDAKGYHCLVDQYENASKLLPSSDLNLIEIGITKIFGTVSLGKPNQIQYFIDNGIFDIIHQFLGSNESAVRRNACWILANFIADNPNQIKLITLNDEMISRLLLILENDFPDARINAAFVFNNFINYLSEFSFEKLVVKGVLKIFIESLSDTSLTTSYLVTFLDVIENFLIYGEDHYRINNTNNIARLIENYYKGTEKIEKLQYHLDEQVYTRAARIIENFFPSS